MTSAASTIGLDEKAISSDERKSVPHRASPTPRGPRSPAPTDRAGCQCTHSPTRAERTVSEKQGTHRL